MHFLYSVVAMLPVLSSVVSGMDLEPRSMPASVMVKNIEKITELSMSLQSVAKKIPTGKTIVARDTSNYNGRLKSRNLGKGLTGRAGQKPTAGKLPHPFRKLIKGFDMIIHTAQVDIAAMKGQVPYSDKDAEAAICDAFRDFVRVHQVLLSIVIGKSGVLESVFLGPVAAVLRSLESVVDTLAFGIIDAVPFCAASATKNKDELDKTLHRAVCAYTPGGTLGVRLFC